MKRDHTADMRAISRVYPDTARAWPVYNELAQTLKQLRDAHGRGSAGFCARLEDGTARGLVTLLAPPGLVPQISDVLERLSDPGEPFELPHAEVVRLRRRHARVLRETPPSVASSRYEFPRGAYLTDDGRVQPREGS